jgi:hypothetical protein
MPYAETFHGGGIATIASAFLNASHNAAIDNGAVGRFNKGNVYSTTIDYATFFNDTAKDEEALFIQSGENFLFEHSNFNALAGKGEIIDCEMPKLLSKTAASPPTLLHLSFMFITKPARPRLRTAPSLTQKRKPHRVSLLKIQSRPGLYRTIHPSCAFQNKAQRPLRRVPWLPSLLHHNRCQHFTLCR